MIIIAWFLVILWGLIALSALRRPLRGLPEPNVEVPEYALWLPDGGDAPPLEPAPSRIHRGSPPQDGPDQLLVLAKDVKVCPDIPARLAGCGTDFVSVIPHPVGALPGLVAERLRRDFAGADKVVDGTHPAGYADSRCAWMRREDLALPGRVGEDRVLATARARKAHVLAVDLRESRPQQPSKGAPQPMVTAPALSWRRHLQTLPDLVGGDPAVWSVVTFVPPILCGMTIALLLPERTRLAAGVAVALGTAARAATAWRDGFGRPLIPLGWILEPALALAGLNRRPRPESTSLPSLPDSPAPRLTAGSAPTGGAWLDHAGVPRLARRFGGSALVMETLYSNRPVGDTALGRLVDRAVHQSRSARAVRHRRLATIAAGRRRKPGRLLSVPCGGAGDAAAINARQTTLVDPDAVARDLARAACPQAQVLDGTVESSPAGPFDMILYVGLSEYLDDAEILSHLGALKRRLAPNGVLLTTVTAAHGEQRRMSRWLGWHTRSRPPETMDRLLSDAGWVVIRRSADALKIQWLLEAEPIEAPLEDGDD